MGINAPTLVSVVLKAAQPGVTHFSLFWLMSLTEPLKGFVNALIFACNSSTATEYRNACCRQHRHHRQSVGSFHNGTIVDGDDDGWEFVDDENASRGYRPKTMSEMVLLDHGQSPSSQGRRALTAQPPGRSVHAGYTSATDSDDDNEFEAGDSYTALNLTPIQLSHDTLATAQVL